MATTPPARRSLSTSTRYASTASRRRSPGLAPGRLDDSRAAVRWTAARGVAACAGAPPRTVEAASVGGDAIETLAPALPRGCGAALEVSLNGQQYEPLGTGGVAYTAVSDCGRGAHAAALVPPRALT